MTKYGLWFCGTEDDAPDWLRDGVGKIIDRASEHEAQNLRTYLYSGEEEIEIREIIDNDGTQEGHTRAAER